MDLATSVERIAEEAAFSGVVRVDRGHEVLLLQAFGLANRACSTPITTGTRFGIASGTKGLTALAVVSLIQDGVLELDTRARAILGDDLPLIDDGVTVEHLLAHRSGIGDYLDEEGDVDLTDHLMPVPVHELASTEEYLRILDGHPAKFAPGERFSYSNGGYVVLALIAERASGIPFHDLVHERVCGPAGMGDTSFLRSDELPAGAATGYLSADGLRTNVLHLPVRGSGDGGIFTTAADVLSMWNALFEGRIVSPEWAARMVRPHSDIPRQRRRYGLGFWLHPSRDTVFIEGADAGVSFRSVHDPAAQLTHTVLSNTTAGAWPIARHLRDTFTP